MPDPVMASSAPAGHPDDPVVAAVRAALEAADDRDEETRARGYVYYPDRADDAAVAVDAYRRAVLDRRPDAERLAEISAAIDEIAPELSAAWKAKWHAAMEDGDGQALTRLELHGQIDALTAERDRLAEQVRQARELAQRAESKYDQYEAGLVVFALDVLAALAGPSA